jgi:hypothetical protein
MANYKELEGFGVQTLATDPDNPGWVGSIFYNSTKEFLKQLNLVELQLELGLVVELFQVQYSLWLVLELKQQLFL